MKTMNDELQVKPAEERLATFFSAIGLRRTTGADNVSTLAAVNPCSWCQKEMGIAPKANESHGICTRHSAALMAEYLASKKQQAA